MSPLGRWTAGVALAVAGVWALRVILGPWPAALIVAPALWAGCVWVVAQVDRIAPAAPVEAPQRTPGAPVVQLDRAQQLALAELADAFLSWRDGPSHPSGRRAEPSRPSGTEPAWTRTG